MEEIIIFSEIVLATSLPASSDPKNSKIAAIKIACFIEIDFEPTAVPIALETSFAPIPHDKRDPNTIAATK